MFCYFANEGDRKTFFSLVSYIYDAERYPPGGDSSTAFFQTLECVWKGHWIIQFCVMIHAEVIQTTVQWNKLLGQWIAHDSIHHQPPPAHSELVNNLSFKRHKTQTNV